MVSLRLESGINWSSPFPELVKLSFLHPLIAPSESETDSFRRRALATKCPFVCDVPLGGQTEGRGRGGSVEGRQRHETVALVRLLRKS